MPVNKERVRLLVDALRSGEYEQGVKALRPEDDKYCCVGVGCDVAQKNGIGIDWLPYLGGGWSFDGMTAAFSPALMMWYGFDYRPERRGDGDPVIGVGRLGLYQITMIGANDTEHWSFEEIAAALEARYLSDEE